jgi:hypothetical protein
MFIVTRDTVLNPSALETRNVPRRFLGRVTLWPARGRPGLWLRVVLEVELWRYLLALVPFGVAAVIFPDYAIAIAQAPLPMLILVYFVESRLLRVPKAQRAGLMPRADVDRGLDLLRARSVQMLTRIAAARGLTQGRLHLVIEQSDLWRAPPLTYVSVQAEDGPEILRLTTDEREMLAQGLFQPPLTETDLLRLNIADGTHLRDIAHDCGRVSAHARLAALMGQRKDMAEGG